MIDGGPTIYVVGVVLWLLFRISQAGRYTLALVKDGGWPWFVAEALFWPLLLGAFALIWVLNLLIPDRPPR